jgi:hypothetical protein
MAGRFGKLPFLRQLTDGGSRWRACLPVGFLQSRPYNYQDEAFEIHIRSELGEAK